MLRQQETFIFSSNIQNILYSLLLIVFFIRTFLEISLNLFPHNCCCHRCSRNKSIRKIKKWGTDARGNCRHGNCHRNASTMNCRFCRFCDSQAMIGNVEKVNKNAINIYISSNNFAIVPSLFVVVSSVFSGYPRTTLAPVDNHNSPRVIRTKEMTIGNGSNLKLSY